MTSVSVTTFWSPNIPIFKGFAPCRRPPHPHLPSKLVVFPFWRRRAPRALGTITKNIKLESKKGAGCTEKFSKCRYNVLKHGHSL